MFHVKQCELKVEKSKQILYMKDRDMRINRKFVSSNMISSLLLTAITLLSLQACDVQGYSTPSSLCLNGKIKSITETSYCVDYKFGDACQSNIECIAMHFGMPCESRTIHFDNNGNITRIETDNSIRQYATYSKSKEILEEAMIDEEGILDYRVYSGDPSKLPLGVKYNNYKYTSIYPRINKLFNFLLHDFIIERHLTNEPYSFKDSIVIIKIKKYNDIYKFHSALAFDQTGEYLYEFAQFVPHRNYERSYYVDSYYDNGKPKLVSERGFKKRFYYNNLGEITQTETYKNNGDLVHRTTYSFNRDKKYLEEKFVLFNKDGYNEEILCKYHYSPERKIIKKNGGILINMTLTVVTLPITINCKFPK